MSLLANPLHNITSLLSSCTSPLITPTPPTPSHPPAGEEVKGDDVKTTKYRPLLQALKGLNCELLECYLSCVYMQYIFSSWWEGGGEWSRELSGKVTTRGCTTTGGRGHIEGRGVFQPRQSSYTTENAEQTAARVSHSPSYSWSLTIFPSLSPFLIQLTTHQP